MEALSDEAGGLFVEFSDDLELVEDQDLADRFMVCCQVTLLQTCKQCLMIYSVMSGHDGELRHWAVRQHGLEGGHHHRHAHLHHGQ